MAAHRAYYELSEEEQAERAREERIQIVGRYDQGREDGAVIDDWEDPKFEIYHTQDRFGFIHDQRVPTASRRSDEERKALEKEMNRVDKWLKMLKEQQKWFPSGARYREKMTERVWKGVPERMRGSLWRILLDLDQIKAEQEGKYQEMKELARRHSPDIRQIDLDVNRTYRNHIMFRERYNTRQQDLFHVLAAYSVYNSEVGYCQGMSQIAALLLMYLNDDEDVFWALSQLMVGRRWNMHGFFIPQFPKLMRFQEHHDKILMKKLRRLQKHLVANGVDTGIYTLKWFFQCFLDRIPFSLVIRVWDVYLLEGETIMFAMAFTILKLHRKALLKMGMDELLEFLQKTLENDFGFDDDYTIETALRDCLADLRSSRLHTAGPAPDPERPQKPFGLHSFPSAAEEAATGRRAPASHQERIFSQETARRGEEQGRRLAALSVSRTSLEDGGSLGSEPDDVIPPPPSHTSPSPGPPVSKEQDELDDSLQFMMRQARQEEGGALQEGAARGGGQEGVVRGGGQEGGVRGGGGRRPASAEPGRAVAATAARGEGPGKRLSHPGHLAGGQQGSRSHSKASHSASRSSMTPGLDTSRTSSEPTRGSPSRPQLDTSTESQSPAAGSPRARRRATQGRREQEALNATYSKGPEGGQRRLVEEALDSPAKKSSYYFGEEPELTNGAVGEVPGNGEDGVREHEGEVVRIRVPYTEPDLTTAYNIQRLNAQKISPRFNGHKVTIQVNHGETGGRLDESFSSEPPSSPGGRGWEPAGRLLADSGAARRQLSKSERQVGSSGEVHTATTALFVAEHRLARRAPLAEQEQEEPRLSSNGSHRQQQAHRHSLHESHSSSSEGEPRAARAQRHSSSTEYRESSSSQHVVETHQHLAEFRKETFF